MAAKQKSSFSCSECNYQTPKWMGCCSSCNAWGTMEEAIIKNTLNPTKTEPSEFRPATTYSMSTIKHQNQPRIITGINEWDRVMGGGIMPSSFIVLTGDPGIGKSTLLLEISQRLSNNHSVLYVSTEESLAQIKERAERLECTFSQSAYFCDAADLESIIATAHELHPEILIIDSIQNCYLRDASSLPGSIAQLKDATFRLMRLAKDEQITIIVTGHITKEGIIAGPKTMEHMVDAVFYLQAEDRWQTRILRSVKNRFGTINELGFFEMTSTGLQEVSNINSYLLEDFSNAPGSTITAIMEGSRPLLLELQALAITSKLSMPQRIVSGIDQKQVVLIAAILEKYLHIKLSAQDIFFKVSGGIKIRDNSTDIGIALALLSSYFQQQLPTKTVAIGEISLTGQIKPINHINMLIKEAEKFGVETVLVAQNQKVEKGTAQIKRLKHVYELLTLFEK
jgi:DNA repair protein RadA/Sms